MPDVWGWDGGSVVIRLGVRLLSGTSSKQTHEAVERGGKGGGGEDETILRSSRGLCKPCSAKCVQGLAAARCGLFERLSRRDSVLKSVKKVSKNIEQTLKEYVKSQKSIRFAVIN